MRVAVCVLLCMAHVIGTKSSVLKTLLKVNTRKLLPWQHIADAYVRNSRQEIRMVSPCDGQQTGRCRQNQVKLHSINDKAFHEVNAAKRQQSTGPPRGWWIYANGHRQKRKKLMPSAQGSAVSTSSTTTSRSIIDDFAKFLLLKPFPEVNAAKRQQSTGPPRGWWIYVNGHRRAKKLVPSAQGSTVSTPSTTTSRAIIDDFAKFLLLKPFHEVNSEKKTAPRQQSTSPPRGWWVYANGHRQKRKRLVPSAKGSEVSTPSTTTSRSIIDDFAKFLLLKHRGALDSFLGK